MEQVHVCVVCEYGWILCGLVESSDDEQVQLREAAVVRCWNNGKGIGGIAKAENKGEYTLDEIGNVEIRKNKILFAIPCEW